MRSTILLSLVFLAILVLGAWSDPTTVDTKTELGRMLFFDPILSKDSTISCASCHKPEFAFSDTVSLSVGVGGKLGKRNTPSVMNMASRGIFFYDGRAATLRNQVHFPIEDPAEMNLAFPEAVKRVANSQKYVTLFKKLYESVPDGNNIRDAIAHFEESLETSDTEFDAWMMDKPNRMSESAIRGRKLFMSDRAKCFDCHFSPDFTGDEFKNIGLYDEKKYVDKGRYEITGNPNDLGKFKVPGLRNVGMTGPYMHDGSFKTLEDVIDYYSNIYDFVSKPINLDTTLIKPIQFTEGEKKDLIAFLHSLTDRSFVLTSR
jgi:cytochrome c peroxidase